MFEEIKALVGQARFLVLATGWQNQPHASLMAFAASLDLSEFYLVTQAETKKFANISRNPQVSLLIDNRGAATEPGGVRALTVAGLCQAAQGQERERALAALAGRHPSLAAFIAQEQTRPLVVQPASFELLDGLGEPRIMTV